MATAETATEPTQASDVDIEAFIDDSRPDSWSRQMVSLFKAGHYREGYEILAEKMPFVESQLRPYAAYLAGEENHWSLSFEHLYRHLDREKSQRVLDVGCAAGSVAIELGRRGHEAWGMDILPAMVERGQAFADSMGLRDQVHLIAGNFDYLMKIRTRSMTEYRIVLAEKISTLPHVANTSTYVAMQAVKENALSDVI